MFQVMEKIGIRNSFTHMIRFLFQDAIVLINISNQATDSFELRRGVCQKCPLTLYLFIKTAETLNATVKNVVQNGHIEGVFFPQCNTQQIISQYVDDTI